MLYLWHKICSREVGNKTASCCVRLTSILVGVAIGAGGFTFVFAEGFSYLFDDPEVCANCHIMNEQLDSFRHGPHRHVAGCGDCHLPASFPSKYLAKARNGLHHSWAFTLQSPRPDIPGERKVFVEPIEIKPYNKVRLEENCRRCHGELVHELVSSFEVSGEVIACTRCHRTAGHGAAF